MPLLSLQRYASVESAFAPERIGQDAHPSVAVPAVRIGLPGAYLNKRLGWLRAAIINVDTELPRKIDAAQSAVLTVIGVELLYLREGCGL